MASNAEQQGAVAAGRIDVADSAIAAIVEHAAISCYGGVDMAPRSLGAAIHKRLGRSALGRGIGVNVLNGRVMIDLSVSIQYRTPIFTTARKVLKMVRFQVERTLGMAVEPIHVSVEGVRASPASAGVRV
ncbi:MAG: Asp23/Gls24 family envelope stress response protein [Thermomicrobiales bacterium]